MKCEKIWKDRGFICFILHNSTFDTLNGYISIPPYHPWYKKSYDDIDIEVHGGLTFSEDMNGEWIIGFDTNHFGDSYGPNCDSSSDALITTHNHKNYRDEEYVTNEIESMVTQALNVCDMYEREDLYSDIDVRMAKLLLTFNNY